MGNKNSRWKPATLTYELNQQNVLLLCSGYLRYFKFFDIQNMQGDDITWIISDYVFSFSIGFLHNPLYSRISYDNIAYTNDIICDFSRNRNTNLANIHTSALWNHNHSTVIFTPYISTLLSKTSKIKSGIVLNIKLSIIDCPDVSMYNRNGGFELNCGLICVPRKILKMSCNYLNSIEAAMNSIDYTITGNDDCAIHNIWSKDERLNDLESIYLHLNSNSCSFVFNDPKYGYVQRVNTNTVRHLNVVGNNNGGSGSGSSSNSTSVSVSVSASESDNDKPIKTKGFKNKFKKRRHKNKNKNKDKDKNGASKRGKNGKNKDKNNWNNYNNHSNNNHNSNNNNNNNNNNKWDNKWDNKFSGDEDSVNNGGVFVRDDYIQVCVDLQKHILFFAKNDNFDKNIGFDCYSENNSAVIDHFSSVYINGGRIPLDFENYDYLFAISSARCSCLNTNGFIFDTNISTFHY